MMVAPAIAPQARVDSQGPAEPGRSIRPDSVVELVPLSIVPEGDAFIVGNAERDVFLALPEIGVVAIRALIAGRSVAEATEAATAHAGEPVDVAGFVEGLVDAGLVAAVDGVSIEAAPKAGLAVGSVRLPGTPTRLAQALFSPVVCLVYGLLTCASVGIFIAQPSLWPSFRDILFHPNVALSLGIMMVLSLVIPAGHEVAHWLAARAVGVGARLSLGRRQYFPVFEADLSGLWSVPRRARYGPFLAGMVYDVVILTACLVPRWAVGEGWLALPPLLVAFLGAMVLRQVLGLAWQTIIFLRTDLYAVLITALGCYQLQRVTRLTVRKWARRLGPEDRAELMVAHPRDVRVAHWFTPLTVVGLAGVYVYLVGFLIPGIVFVTRWVVRTLTTASPDSGAFWQAITIGLIITVQVLLPLGLILQQRLLRRGADRA